MQPATPRPSMRLRTVLPLMLGIFLAAASASAQPTLDLIRVETNWPLVEVYFRVTCDGQPVDIPNAAFFTVKEQGIEIQKFTFWKPDSTRSYRMSAALVFDAGTNMLGAGLNAIREAGHAFIDRMDGLQDQGAIISYNQSVRLWQGMTTDTALLHAPIDSIRAGGGSTLYDGVYAGLSELVDRGINEVRAVVVFSGTADNGSRRTPSEIIALAKSQRIRIYTIGYGSGCDQAALQHLAVQTGGTYSYTIEGAKIRHVYDEISSRMQEAFNEYAIYYTTSCKDGALREVELTVTDICGSNDTTSLTYTAPRDPNGFVVARIAPTEVTSGDTLVTLPIVVQGVPGTQVLRPFACTVKYDTSSAQLMSVTTSGTLLEDVEIEVLPLPGGADIRTRGSAVVHDEGALLGLVFTVPRHMTADTVRTRVWLEQWSFETGCLSPQIGEGELRSVADWRATCTLTVPEVTADHIQESYAPMPVPVTTEVQNIGALGMDDVVVRLSVSGDARILAADSLVSTIVLAPPRLESGNRLSPQWLVRMLPKNYTRRIPIEVSVLHRGVEVSRCGNDLVIPPVRPPLLPKVTFEGSLRVCAGDSVTLDAGGPYAAYRWNSGDTTRRITVRASGAYVVTVTDNLARVAMSDTAWVVVAARPAPRLAVAGSLRFCQGDSVLLDAGAGWASYLWSTGATTRTLRTGEEGMYWVRVTSVEGCAGLSDTVQTTLLLRPPVPVITRTGDVLSTEAGHAAYRWYRDGVLIAGAAGPSLAVTENGVYTVELVNGFGCTSMSAPYDMVTALAGVDAAVDAWRIEAWPDPVQGDLTVRVRASAYARVDLRVVDVLGRTVHAVRALAGESSVVVPLAGLPPGAYHIIATGAGMTLHHRIMKR